MHRRINWALMLATLASAFALYAIKYDTRRLEARVQAQERALEKAESDVTVLTAERAHLARPERLEPLARAHRPAPIAAAQYLRLEARSRSPSAERDTASGRRRESATPMTAPTAALRRPADADLRRPQDGATCACARTLMLSRRAAVPLP